MEHELGATSFKAFLSQVNQPDKQTLTEADLFCFMWEMGATTSMKAALKKEENLFFVDATKTMDGTNNRPTTLTILEAWYEDYQPEPGSYHANVEQPHGLRIGKTLRLFLEKKSRVFGNSSKQFSII